MKNKKGFTLVECIVAITIILVITASAIGIYQTALNSSNRQWNRYVSTVMADNALACFQSSDNMSDFESKLSELQADGNIIKNPGADVTVTATYNELVLSGGQAVETPFSKVRAWNNKDNKGGLVQFLKDDNTSIADFSYGDALSNTTDTVILKNADGVYDVFYTESESGKIESLSYKLTKKKSDYTVTYNYLPNNSSSEAKSSDLYMHITGEKNTVHWKASSFEKYLFENRLILKPVAEGNFTSAFSHKNKWSGIFCEIYQLSKENNIINCNRYTALGKYIYIEKCCTYCNWYETCDTHQNVTVKTCNETSYNKAQKLTINNVTTESFEWQYFPVLMADIYSSDITVSNYTFTSTNSIIYTDYVLKSGYTPKINYELKSNGKIEIYAPGDIKLYSYTGKKISDAHNKIIENCAFSQDTTYSGTSGTEKYTCVKNSDGIQMTSVAYDEQAKKIKFMNGATEVISFEYGTNEAAFENDKPTAQNSAYSTFYENNAIKNPNNLSISVQRIPVNSTSFCYQISLINADGTQTAIFSTSYGNISTNQGASFSGLEKTKSVMIDGASYTKYFYYIPPKSDVGCYIMVTFSKVSSGDTSVEPKIKAWILSASDITALQNDSRSDKTQNDILKKNRCCISYRKG